MKKNYTTPDVSDIKTDYAALLCASNGTSEGYSGQEDINDDFNWE